MMMHFCWLLSSGWNRHSGILKRFTMNAELSERVKARLVQSGEEERIRELLKTRLVSCGWKDELKAEARKLIKERGWSQESVHSFFILRHLDIFPYFINQLSCLGVLSTITLSALIRAAGCHRFVLQTR